MSETSCPTGESLPSVPETLTGHGEACVGGLSTLVERPETFVPARMTNLAGGIPYFEKASSSSSRSFAL
jgi:hypothetical protein